jgi:hypothetical protein
MTAKIEQMALQIEDRLRAARERHAFATKRLIEDPNNPRADRAQAYASGRMDELEWVLKDLFGIEIAFNEPEKTKGAGEC